MWLLLCPRQGRVKPWVGSSACHLSPCSLLPEHGKTAASPLGHLPHRLWVYTDLISVSLPTLQVLDRVAGGASPVSGEDRHAWLLRGNIRKRLK